MFPHQQGPELETIVSGLPLRTYVPFWHKHAQALMYDLIKLGVKGKKKVTSQWPHKIQFWLCERSLSIKSWGSSCKYGANVYTWTELQTRLTRFWCPKVTATSLVLLLGCCDCYRLQKLWNSFHNFSSKWTLFCSLKKKQVRHRQVWQTLVWQRGVITVARGFTKYRIIVQRMWVRHQGIVSDSVFSKRAHSTTSF